MGIYCLGLILNISLGQLIIDILQAIELKKEKSPTRQLLFLNNIQGFFF